MDQSHPTNERGPMVGDNLKVMKKYLTQLINGITDPHPLISCLDGKGVLADRHKQMLDLEKCNYDKVRALIHLLKDDCRGGFIPFVESLQETGHISLAKLLLDGK
ncbi:hypothetical protein SNE40_021995 [Patella caerulea]|uniref:CARD domain-containing protein n=1 Tax=Patella caerulea TaxID=87958 RepID=A0AAN8G0R0_PATCE